MSEPHVEQASWYMVLGGLLSTNNEHDGEVVGDPKIDKNNVTEDTAICEIESEHVADFPPSQSYMGIVASVLFIMVGLVITIVANKFIGIGIWTAALIALILTSESTMIDPALCWVAGFISLTAFNIAMGILIFTIPSVALVLVMSQVCIIMSSLSRLALHVTTTSSSQIDHNPDIELAEV